MTPNPNLTPEEKKKHIDDALEILVRGLAWLDAELEYINAQRALALEAIEATKAGDFATAAGCAVRGMLMKPPDQADFRGDVGATQPKANA
jgi:hypothetical protein